MRDTRRDTDLAASSSAIRDLAGIQRQIEVPRQRTILFVVHSSPFAANLAGAEFHVRDLIRALALPRVVIAYPGDRELVAAEVFHGDVKKPFFYRFALSQTPNLVCIEMPEVTRQLQAWTNLFAISGVHIQHLLGWPIAIGGVLRQMRIPFVYTSHDYYAVCPNWTLFDHGAQRICDCSWEGGGDAGCLAAFARVEGWRPSHDLALVRRGHRDAFLKFLGLARGVVFPSDSAFQRVRRALPLDTNRAQIIEHGCDVQLRISRPPPDGVLRIGVVGGVAGMIKGERNYQQLVSRTRDLPLEWYFFGITGLPGVASDLAGTVPQRRVWFHGSYEREDIADLLAAAGIDLCVLFPNVDETFSYVLSEVFAAKLPVLVNQRGALPERVMKTGAGVVVSNVEHACQWLRQICLDRTQLAKLSRLASSIEQPTHADNARAHLAMYQRLGLLTPGPSIIPGRVALDELLARHTETNPAPPRGGPAPAYQRSRGYPLFLRVKRYLPASLRRAGRAALLRGDAARRALRRGRWTSAPQWRMSELRVVGQKGRSFLYQPIGANPCVLLDLAPLRSENVQAMRFRLRHRSLKPGDARLFWTHSFGEDFSDRKSLRVALTRSWRWHRYRFDLSEEPIRADWRGGPEVVKIRLSLDITDADLELGAIEFKSP